MKTSSASWKLPGRSPKGFEPGIAPHSPYTLSENCLKGTLSLARQRSLPLSIHLAESREETQWLQDRSGGFAEKLYPFVGWEPSAFAASGERPVAYLFRRLPSGLRPLLVHGVQVQPEEIRRIARSGLTVVLCPRSNTTLGVGTAPVADYLAEGVPLALGTDSLASASSLSVWDELAHLRNTLNAAVASESLFHMATEGGGRALGLGDEMGRLAPGMGAHFQVLHPPTALREESLFDLLCAEAGAWPLVGLYLRGVNCLPKQGRLD